MAKAKEKNIRVWGIETGRAMRVHWMARELNLEYEVIPITARSGETQTDSFTVLNPKQKIPVFQHGPLVLTESAAIIGYMSDAFPLPKGFLRGNDATGRAKINEWCYFAMTELDAHSLYLIRRHDSLKEIYGAEPTAVASAEEYFKKQIGAASKRMTDGCAYLVENQFSIADILMTSCLDWATLYEIDVPEIVHKYREHVRKRPGYQDAKKVNFPNGIPKSVLRST